MPRSVSSEECRDGAPVSGQPENGLWVVGLVASVGGLDALGEVLASLPAGFLAAVVALQHIRP